MQRTGLHVSSEDSRRELMPVADSHKETANPVPSESKYETLLRLPSYLKIVSERYKNIAFQIIAPMIGVFDTRLASSRHPVFLFL